MVLQAALKDKILSEELEFEELLKADDDGDGDVSQSEYILYKLEQVHTNAVTVYTCIDTAVRTLKCIARADIRGEMLFNDSVMKSAAC
jgi:hypothetical protein